MSFSIERRIKELKNVRKKLHHISYNVQPLQRDDLLKLKAEITEVIRKLENYSNYHLKMRAKYQKFEKRPFRLMADWEWHCIECKIVQKNYISRESAHTGATRHMLQTTHTQIVIKQGR